MRAVFTIFFLLAGCIEAPPAVPNNNSETDMTEQPQDMSESNNVIDMSRPVVSPDMDSDVPTSDMDADQSEPGVPTFAIKLEAPSVSTEQQNIPLWVQVRNQEELLTYQNNQAKIIAGTPSELIYLIPNAQSKSGAHLESERSSCSERI